MDRQGDARMAYTAHGFFFNVVVVADGWIISPVSPLRPTFPFSACCPGTDHLAIHLGPVLLITRLGLRMRTTVPPCRSETSCALKRGTSTLGLFSSVFLSLSLSPFSFAIDGKPRLSRSFFHVLLSRLSVYVFFTLLATKGPLSVARRARLFYTPNVIQPRSYLLSVSLPFRVVVPLFIHVLFLFRPKVFLKP